MSLDDSIKEVQRVAGIVKRTQPEWGGHLEAVATAAVSSCALMSKETVLRAEDTLRAKEQEFSVPITFLTIDFWRARAVYLAEQIIRAQRPECAPAIPETEQFLYARAENLRSKLSGTTDAMLGALDRAWWREQGIDACMDRMELMASQAAKVLQVAAEIKAAGQAGLSTMASQEAVAGRPEQPAPVAPVLEIDGAEFEIDRDGDLIISWDGNGLKQARALLASQREFLRAWLNRHAAPTPAPAHAASDGPTPRTDELAFEIGTETPLDDAFKCWHSMRDHARQLEHELDEAKDGWREANLAALRAEGEALRYREGMGNWKAAAEAKDITFAKNLEEAITARSAIGEPVAWIEHHKGGDNLNWGPIDWPGHPATPLYAAPRSASARAEG